LANVGDGDIWAPGIERATKQAVGHTGPGSSSPTGPTGALRWRRCRHCRWLLISLIASSLCPIVAGHDLKRSSASPTGQSMRATRAANGSDWFRPMQRMPTPGGSCPGAAWGRPG
jgi:hypothetical protein